MEKLDAVTESSFFVKQGRYEGPYLKLLSMIESRKLSISEISLAQIADDYISYIKTLDKVDPMDMSLFVQVAATLMLIKAKSLLPNIEYTEEEKGDVDKLEKKLSLLKELKECELNIKEVWTKNVYLNRKSPLMKRDRAAIPSFKLLTFENVYSVAVLTLAKMPSFERLRQVAVRQAIRIEKVIERIMEHINVGTFSLKNLAKTLGGEEKSKDFKKNIIVSFLAILELLKTGVIDAFEVDGDIEIKKTLEK